MFSSDKPIQRKEEDALKRTTFSKQLAKAIVSYTKTDNFVVSLCGRWGSGKTSILNLVLEEINAITQDGPEEERPIIIRFNPWNYTDCAQLVSQFFAEISTNLKTRDSSKEMRYIGEALERYSSLFEYSQYIPVVGKYIAPLHKALTSTGGWLKKKSDENNSLEEKKKKVTEALSNQKHKFIIVIDDIDRLNNAQIRAVFQLVNSVAGFPNMIYFLLFDREVVARALHEEQNCDGEEYLEKIIQVLFDVPEASPELISNVFIERYINIIFKEDEEIDFDTEYWQKIYDSCIRPFTKGIRDVNRILNSYEFKYNLMKNEINEVDLLAITTLQICAPDIYKWIVRNSNLLVGGVENYGGISGVEQKENAERYKKSFGEVYAGNSELMLSVMQALFPRFAWKTGGYSRSRETNDELRRKNKIASVERIQRYFNLSLEDIPIGQGEIKNTITTYTAIQLQEYLESLLQNGKLNFYLQELSAHLWDIPDERVVLFIEALMRIQENDLICDPPKALSSWPKAKCMSVVKELFNRNNKQSNRELLIKLIRNADKKSIYVLADIVGFLEEVYGKCGDYINSKYQFVLESDLDDIEKEFIQRIHEKVENLFEGKDFDNLFNLWGILDPKNRDEHVISLMKDEINIPKLLSLYAGTWRSSNNMTGWTFREGSFDEYISSEDAYNGINKLKNKRFAELDERFKEIAIAYALWYESKDKNKNNVNHEIGKKQVDLLIPEWE